MNELDVSWVTLDSELSDYATVDGDPLQNAECIANTLRDLQGVGVDPRNCRSDGKEVHFTITLKQAFDLPWEWDHGYPHVPDKYLATLLLREEELDDRYAPLVAAVAERVQELAEKYENKGGGHVCPE